LGSNETEIPHKAKESQNLVKKYHFSTQAPGIDQTKKHPGRQVRRYSLPD
jgi:hypothetical protein